MPTTKSVSNDKLYDRLDAVRLELKQDIVNAVTSVAQNQGRLEAKFDNLEAGRLTRNEQKMTDLELKLQKFEGAVGKDNAVITTRIAIYYALGAGVFIIASEVLLNWIVSHK